MLQGPAGTIRQSRRLRREMSLPEILLWQELRKRPAGLKFRKQHPAGPYTADFFCHAAKLVVEVDSEAHDRGERPVRDAERDRWFALRRLAVMRIPAAEVLGNLDGVLAGILDRAGNPLQHAAHGPPPRAGEGL